MIIYSRFHGFPAGRAGGFAPQDDLLDPAAVFCSKSPYNRGDNDIDAIVPETTQTV